MWNLWYCNRVGVLYGKYSCHTVHEQVKAAEGRRLELE